MSIENLLKKQTLETVSEEHLGEIGKAINKMLAKQREIADAEMALKALKQEEEKINQVEIPELMENLGFSEIKLKTGEVVTVADNIHISIPAPLRSKAYNWMDVHGHGDLIKTNVTAVFPRGDHHEAHAFKNRLVEDGLNATLVEAVHSGTLKAWGKAELNAGHELPSQLFKIFISKITKVK
jgi:hypothetical protein